ncbi:MAG: GAF and ANTAR domain-containing protein [Acidimicrobiales bacterium]|nr:GAF and ANTAR domain-containing protein [Acidimicrobiales bacterium]
MAAAGCRLIRGRLASSITLVEHDRPATVTAIEDVARTLDEVQYDQGDGPCLTAARSGAAVHVEDTAALEKWPEFRDAAMAQDVRSVLSIPLSLVAPMQGGLNLYSRSPHGFEETDEEIGRTFGSQAATMVSNSIASWDAFEQSKSLMRAMESRAVIEQAKGVLMARQRCTADVAFDLLR